MVCFKGFQWDDGLHLSVADTEDAPAASGSSCLVPCSLRRTKVVAQVWPIKPSSFAQQLSIRVERGANDGSEVCLYPDRSNLIIEFFMLGHQIIAETAQ